MAPVPSEAPELAEGPTDAGGWEQRGRLASPKPVSGRPRQGQEEEVSRPRLERQNAALRVLIMAGVVFFQWIKSNHLA